MRLGKGALRVQHPFLSSAFERGYRSVIPSDRAVESWATMLARFALEVHLWTIPLLLATGCVIGYVHFRDTLRREYGHWCLEWRRRTSRKEPE
jgi:hypothetical protein